MGILRVVPVIMTIACILVGTMALDASARGEARWMLQTGDIIVGWDGSFQKPQASIFHQQTAFASDVENLKIDFPITADNLGLGPTTGTALVDSGIDVGSGGTANILPMGPVNLAFPNIHEDVTQEVDTTSTGFFTANWAFMADTASSNLGTEPIGIYPASGHPFKNPKMLGSEFIWPYMVPTASAAVGSLALDMDSLSPGIVPGVPALENDVSIIKRDTVDITPDARAPTNATSAMNVMRAANATTATNATNVTTTTNATAATNATNATTKQKPEGWGQRKPRIDSKMTKEQIKNSTTLQRMYRNAFVGTTMHKAYEGSTNYPTWITPYDNGLGCFNACDRNKMIELALKKVVPGARIAPVFWDM